MIKLDIKKTKQDNIRTTFEGKYKDDRLDVMFSTAFYKRKNTFFTDEEMNDIVDIIRIGAQHLNYDLIYEGINRYNKYRKDNSLEPIILDGWPMSMSGVPYYFSFNYVIFKEVNKC